MRLKAESSGLFHITKAAAKDFSQDQCGLRAAALSYYTVFALPPLLILLIKLAGLVWDPTSVQTSLESQFGGLVGSGGATQVRQMVASGEHASHGTFGPILGIGGLLLGATGAFLSLQNALNAVWEVKPDPEHGGIIRFITKRLLSLGMVMGLAFLLVVSLAVTAALSALGRRFGAANIVMQIVTTLVSMAVISVLFAAMFKFLPDATVRWRSVWVGGIATAVLFELGKLGIGLYLGRSNPGNAFGAASALAVILVWIYYVGMLVLFGAEFTQHYAEARGHAVEPKKGAVRVRDEERIVRPDNENRGSQQSNYRRTPSPMPTDGARGDSAMYEERLDNQTETLRVPSRADFNGRGRQGVHDASIGELFKQLSSDGSHLIQQEIQLAKTELQDSAARAGKAGAKIGTAMVLALPGVMAITAAVVIGLGILIDSYWVSALIVGAAILIVAGILIKRAMSAFRGGFAPRQAIETARQDVDWAKREVPRVKHELSA
jgi:membrane protein